MSGNIQGGDCSSSASCPSPEQRSESRGSSVSAELREEYEDILKYAVVAPKLLGGESSLQASVRQQQQQQPPVIETQLDSEEENSSQSLPSQLPSPPHPTSPPPHPSLHNHTPSPSPPPITTHQTMAQQSSVPPQQPLIHTTNGSHDINHGSHDLTHGSHDLTHGSHDSHTGMDPEVARLGTQLDAWCLDLKRNVLAEFEQARLRLLEKQQREMEGQLQQQAHALHQVQEELERYKELVATFEASVARKDQLIASLNTSLEKQKSRVELQKSFSTWKIQHHDDQREAFTSALARRHYHTHLRARVWEAWFGIIRERWRQKVERACQTKAEEVCVQLTDDYDERLAVSQRTLNEAHQEILQLKAERSLYEQNMKQAFMRGVCALNMEAMTMFRGHQSDDDDGDHGNGLTTPTSDDHGNEYGGDDGQASGPVGSNPSMDLPAPPNLLPSHSAPHTHHHGNQINIPQTHSFCFPPQVSQPTHITPHTAPTCHNTHPIGTSSVRIQTAQQKVKSSTRGRSSHKRGCGRSKPAVMVERHNIA